MVQQGGGIKFSGAKQESINDYSQTSRMAKSNKNDHYQQK